MDINNDKIALVTGATKGIGKAISLALVKEGYKLIACARNRDLLSQLKIEVEENIPNSEIFVQSCDFSSSAQVSQLTSWLETNSLHVDVLVNNVGLFIPGSIFKEADDALSRHMQVNVFTPYHLSVYIGRKMRERKNGHIFNISSVASRDAIAAAGSYSITKHALAGLTSVLREDLKKDNVKVSEIIPGSTLTSSWEGTTVPPEEFVLPEDIAQILVSVLKMSKGANVDKIVIKPVKGQI